MHVPTRLLSLLLIAAGTVAAPVISYGGVAIEVEVAPPPVQVEVVPAARVGYVWAPGYWTWEGGRHVWVSGHWMRERLGYHWVPAAWVQVGARWRFERGHWQRG
jgi:YXWGXW repeat-containing protein